MPCPQGMVMKYTQTVPCNNCPWRKETSCLLIPARVKELQKNMLSWGGGAFPCHKTVDYSNNSNGVETPNSVHCAGALIFAEKQGFANQMMRIAERLRLYDARKLMTNNPAIDQVFDSPKEMLDYHTEKGKRDVVRKITKGRDATVGSNKTSTRKRKNSK